MVELTILQLIVQVVVFEIQVLFESFLIDILGCCRFCTDFGFLAVLFFENVAHYCKRVYVSNSYYIRMAVFIVKEVGVRYLGFLFQFNKRVHVRHTIFMEFLRNTHINRFVGFYFVV